MGTYVPRMNQAQHRAHLARNAYDYDGPANAARPTDPANLPAFAEITARLSTFPEALHAAIASDPAVRRAAKEAAKVNRPGWRPAIGPNDGIEQEAVNVAVFQAMRAAAAAAEETS